jgi:hypothetical protein
MNTQDIYLPPKSSSSSAVDLTVTSTGLVNSAPSSPSNRQDTFTRRRPSWGRVDAGQDPLRLPLHTFLPSAVVSDPDRITSDAERVTYTLDDPLSSPIGHPDPALGFSYGSVNSRYEIEHDDINTYSTAQPGPSSTSLIRGEMEGTREDDEARLTTNMAYTSSREDWDPYVDAERSAGSSSRSLPKAAQYTAPPSPLKKTSTAFKRVSQNLRRMSLRVVNLGGTGLESQIRLPDNDDDRLSPGKSIEDDDDFPDLNQNLPLRGRTLGFFGPTSSLRFALFRCLVHR